MKSYKGFNKDLTCRGFQFEEGKEYEEPTAKICKSGFHACEMPLDCFKYYKPSESVYHEVEQDGVISRANDDSKVASTKIKIGARIGIKGLVKAQVDFVLDRAKKESAATSGEESSAAVFNKNGIALACGKNSRAKGVLGSFIVLTEWDEEAETIISAKLTQVDGEKIKADTWYRLKNGNFVECGEDDDDV